MKTASILKFFIVALFAFVLSISAPTIGLGVQAGENGSDGVDGHPGTDGGDGEAGEDINNVGWAFGNSGGHAGRGGNGVDSDGDALIDMNDPGCTDPSDDEEADTPVGLEITVNPSVVNTGDTTNHFSVVRSF